MQVLQKFAGKSFITILLLTGLAVYNVPAMAVKKGFYIGGSIGESDMTDVGELSVLCAQAGIICDTDATDTAVKIFGGYQFNNYVALELGYVDLGELDIGTSAPISAEALFEVSGGFLLVVPQIPIGKIGAIFAKAGLLVGDAKLGVVAPSIGFADSDSTTAAGIVFGFGGAINLGERVTVRVEWERNSFDETLAIAGINVDAPDVDVISGTVIIHF